VEHNRLRSRVAMGSTRQPSAADMMELQWDEELATVAQRHADQCDVGHDCNDCRRVSRFKVGQNVWRGRDSRYRGPDWKYIINDWFSEIDIFPGGADILNYRLTPGTGHYTQLAWGETSLVGCGLIIHRSSAVDQLFTRYYVCNYGRGGNRLRKKMYQPGRPCSSCPQASGCSSRYAGLCDRSGAGSGFFTKANSPTRFSQNNTRIKTNSILTSNKITSTRLKEEIPRETNQIRNFSPRRQPRLTEPRPAPRLGVTSEGREIRQRTYRQRQKQSSRCRNIWCQLTRLFQ